MNRKTPFKPILCSELTASFRPNNKSLRLLIAIAESVLEESYHGLIKENETFVEITPVIKFSDDKVCRLEIVKSQKDIPFKVRICLHVEVGGTDL